MLRLSQGKYVLCILDKFNMVNCKEVWIALTSHFKIFESQCPTNDMAKAKMSCVLYEQAVCTLTYLMMCTRPNIPFAMGKVSKYMSNPEKVHWEAMKWISIYLMCTLYYGLLFYGLLDNVKSLFGYVDADYGQYLN